MELSLRDEPEVAEEPRVGEAQTAVEEPMWEMGIESPLAVLTWSLPLYSVAMERLLRSLVMW
jgi:hypothetical protein